MIGLAGALRKNIAQPVAQPLTGLVEARDFTASLSSLPAGLSVSRAGQARYTYRNTGGTLPVTSNLKLRLDASNPGSVNISSGKVTQWNDISGNNHHAVQGTSANQPTYDSTAFNGLGGIRTGDGGTTYLTVTDHADFDYTTCSIYVVVMPLSSASGQVMVKQVAAGSEQEFILARNANRTFGAYHSVNGTSYQFPATTLPLMYSYSPYIMDLQNGGSGANWVATLNDNASGASSSALAANIFNGAGNIHIGANGSPVGNKFEGYIAEVLFYNVKHSAGDRTLVMDYLRDKWHGIQKTAANDAGVIEYAMDGTLLGLRSEKAGTNLTTYSEDYSNAAHVKSGATVTANQATAPDGTLTMDKLSEDSSTGQHTTSRNYSGLTPGGKYAMSEFIKAGDVTKVQLGSWDGSAGIDVGFDLANGTILYNPSGAEAYIIPAPFGCWRCVVARTIAGTTLSAITYLHNGTSVSYAGTTGNGVFVWGKQFEAGQLSSYIPTTTAAVTRPADVISGTLEDADIAANSGGGVIYGEFTPYSFPASGYGIIAALGKSTGGFSHQLGIDFASKKLYCVTYYNGVAVAEQVIGSAMARGTTYKLAYAWAPNNCNGAAAGTLGTPDTSCTVPSGGNAVDTLFLGGAYTTQQCCGHLKNLSILASRPSETTLGALTA